MTAKVWTVVTFVLVVAMALILIPFVVAWEWWQERKYDVDKL